VIGEDEAPKRRSILRSRDSPAIELAFAAGEAAIYLVVATLLVVAAIFTAVGTVTDVIEGSDSRSITDTGLFILSRVLLMFIIAELLYTLRLVNLDGRILVEPFLFIGLIAVVRRILVITAEIEGHPNRDQINNFIIQVAALGGLALVLSLSIHFLRRSAQTQP
jgi:uncharacterized membrane protein (DUF373 family)